MPPLCAKALLNHYKPDSGIEKPTIHVAGIYTASNKFSDAVESLQCLAKLEHVGFSILPWDFNAFKQFVSESACMQEINEHHENNSIEYMKLVAQLGFIHQISEKNSHANSWCE